MSEVDYCQTVDGHEQPGWTSTTDYDPNTTTQYYPQTQGCPQGVCPRCGYCPHCGRGGYRWPYYPQPHDPPIWPYYPPIWSYTNGSGPLGVQTSVGWSQ